MFVINRLTSLKAITGFLVHSRLPHFFDEDVLEKYRNSPDVDDQKEEIIIPDLLRSFGGDR